VAGADGLALMHDLDGVPILHGHHVGGELLGQSRGTERQQKNRDENTRSEDST